MKPAVIAVLAASLVAFSASAQRPVGQNQPPDQWVMNCNTEKGRDCTVSAMIDGGPNNLLGTFLIVSYSVAYTTITVVVDGVGKRASMQIGEWPRLSTTICTGGACSYDQERSAELLQELLRGQQVTIQVSLQDDSMVGPLSQSLNGFATQYQRAVRAQQQGR